MTNFRLNELKALFWKTQLDRTFKTNGMVKEIFFPKDIVNIIPSIKISSKESNLGVKNIIYFIHSDPSNRTCRSCGDFRVDKGLIPKSTLDYVYSIIESDFLSEPTKCGDRFDGVDKENINERVEFDLTFEPISLKYNLITDIWILMLNVGEIDGGKRYGFTKIHYFDKDGTAINCSLSGYPNETYIENNEIYIKMFICDDYRCESGMIKLCKYDKLKHEIIFVKDLGRQELE